MPDVIKAALTTDLAIRHSQSAITEVPQELQYMPPGTHRINASRNGKPVTLDIKVDASTAETLDAFLKAQLTKASEGNDDRPFFDFNHEDREAAAWPTEFYWAGDDPRTGGVRAKIEWSGAGEKAVKDKTFRRFSPTFVPDAQGKVIGSETNMGGLVNRAAFKSIQPLFAKASFAPGENLNKSTMKTLLQNLKNLDIISSTELSPEAASMEAIAAVEKLREDHALAIQKVEALEYEKAAAVKARATSQVDAAVKAGRIASKDADAKAFWQDALIRDEVKAVKAIESLPVNPVLAKVTGGDDPKSGLLDKMQLQQKKLAEVQASSPGADFQTIFAKAQAEAPDLFR